MPLLGDGITCADWTKETATGPAARSGHKLAYDSARQRVVMFGGATGTARLNDTWEWNGSAWAQKTVTGPTARSGHAMAFDAARGQVVLFGGFAGSAAQSDTWVFNGTAWSQKTVTGPSARSSPAMAYDPVRQRVVLYGGYSTAPLSDTWEWDGSAWTQSSATGAPAMDNPSMVYDTVKAKLLMVGPAFGTWERSGTGSWLQTPAGAGLAPDVYWTNSTMAWDPNRKVAAVLPGQILYVAGEWNGTFWSFRDISGRPFRRSTAMAYDAARQRVVMFGGIYGSTTFSDTWTYGP